MNKIILYSILNLIIFQVHSQQNVSLGILSDFDKTDPRSHYLNSEISKEIQRVTGAAYNVTLSENNIFSSQWDTEKAKENYKKLASSCDIIVLIGNASIHGALQNQPFTKPSIGLGAFDIKLQNLPFTTQETSGIENFTYILTAQNMKEDLKEFNKIAGFKNLAFIYDQRTNIGLNLAVAEQKMKELKELLNITITFIKADPDTINSILNRSPDKIDAAYIAVPFELNANEVSQIMVALNNKKIPTLSMNQQYINHGALLAFSKDNGLEYLIRKTAIQFDEALNGKNLGDMNVNINKTREMFLNLSTADKIGFYPDFQTLFTANIIYSEKKTVPIYSIQDIIKTALEKNLNIQLSNMDIQLSEKEIEYAKSNFLPDLDVSANAVWIDENSASPLVGQAERSINANAKVMQVIYSESAIANIKIQRFLLQAQKYATEQEILMQVLNCYNAYFSILQAKTNVNIRTKNLNAYKTNLELAQQRVNIGAKNNADVYRWESEVANAKQALIEANTNLLIAKLQLNNLLNNSLEEDYDIKDATLDDEIFKYTRTSTLAKFFDTPAKLISLTDFLINEAKTSYPAKKQLLENLNAIERQKIMNKRLFYSPTIALAGQMDQNLYRGGEGSEPIQGLESLGVDSEFHNTTWNTAISVSLPIIDGKRRKIDLQKTRIQQEQLVNQINSLDQDLSLQVRANALQVMASGTKIMLSKTSAENTENNYKLVQENYMQGTVSITQLIDAQKAAFSAGESYALSVYEYLLNFLSLENSVGFYSMLSTPEEQEALRERFLSFIANEK